MVGNIINQMGGGSGIDTKSLVDQLVELERGPQEKRLDSRQEKLEAQISGFGALRGELDKLESSLLALSDPDTFDAKSVAQPQTNLLTINKLEPDAEAGNYQLRVDQIAQAQSMASAGFASASDPVGMGEITLRFGSWDATADNFTVNPDREGATLTIDETNNSLHGVRDAINGADLGVQARVVEEGGEYRLMVTSPSGAENELEITVNEDAGNPGLASFAYSEAQQSMEGLQEGRDAIVRVNGLSISRPDNRMDDVITGVEFDIFNSDPDEVINLNITEDRSMAEQAIREFVDTYNNFLVETERLVGFDPEKEDFGSLQRDPLANNLIERLRGTMSSSVPGIDGGFDMLASLGIRTNRDGTLEIVEDGTNTDFRAALDNNFDRVKELFTPHTESSNTGVTVTGHGNRTQPGSYEVEITQDPSRGHYEGDAITAGFPLDTTGKDYSFEITVDGTTSQMLSLPDGVTYASPQELANQMQAMINSDEGLQNANASVSVTYNSATDAFDIYSNEWGSSSVVNMRTVGADMADLGITAKQGTQGMDVEGTIDGEAAFGYGQVLLPAIGSPAEGLSMRVAPGTTNATVSFSRGFGGTLTGVMDSYLASSGLISQREESIERDLSRVADDRETMERRSEAHRARLESQFRAMEQIVRSLNSTNTFLDGIVDRLPFTAPSN